MPLPLPDSTSHPDLSGRVVFVTGATGGLGRALALAIAECGATVVLHARVVRKLEALYDEIAAAGGPQPTILPLDFTAVEAEAFGTTASAIASQLGRLDALVHTAVFLGSVAPIEHQALDKWQKAFAVNVGAAMALTRSCLPLLNAAPDASVVFTLDSRALDPRAYWGAYGATKAAVAALAATLADEWENRPNLRVNAVIPGAIRTPLRTRTHPGEDRFALPPPESLVPLYLHLVAGQSKSESGVCIDGPSWLAGQPAATPLVSGSGSPGSRP